MMNTRGKALGAMAKTANLTALAHVETGIQLIRDFYKQYESELEGSKSAELAVLKALRKEIREQLPGDPIHKIKQRLADAVAEEKFEEAARLRDELESFLERHRNSTEPNSASS